MLKWLWPVQEPITLYELHYWEDGSDNKVRQIWTYPFFCLFSFSVSLLLGSIQGVIQAYDSGPWLKIKGGPNWHFCTVAPGQTPENRFERMSLVDCLPFFLIKKKKKGKTKTGRSNQFPLTTDPPIQVLAKTRTPCGGDVGKIGPCWEQMPSERSDRSLFR